MRLAGACVCTYVIAKLSRDGHGFWERGRPSRSRCRDAKVQGQRGSGGVLASCGPRRPRRMRCAGGAGLT